MKTELEFGTVIVAEVWPTNANLISMVIYENESGPFITNTFLTKVEAIELANKLLELAK